MLFNMGCFEGLVLFIMFFLGLRGGVMFVSRLVGGFSSGFLLVLSFRH